MAFYDKIDVSKKLRLGSRRKDYAGNEYIYMKGVASLAARDAVIFDENFATTRLLAALTTAGPVAIAMSANTSATNYSWFQIWGNASATAAGTVAADAQLQATATAGQIDDTTTAAKTRSSAASQWVQAPQAPQWRSG
jgi:hypothetical protein